MQISVLYRTHAGVDHKQRPGWFDRAAALRSLREAMGLAGVPTTLTFVVDGSMPPELARLVSQDDVVIISGGSTARSLRACVRVGAELAGRATDDTLFWFAEDDYAYRPESFAQLSAAVQSFDDVDYFTLYVPDEPVWHDEHPSQPLRALRTDEEVCRDIDGRSWHRVRETTSTFGVRAAALRADHRLLRLGSMVGAPFDAATWVALQGVGPFSYRRLFEDLSGSWDARGMAKVVAKPFMRVALNLVATSPLGSPRRLVAPVDDLAMHLEAALVPLDGQWDILGLKKD